MHPFEPEQRAGRQFSRLSRGLSTAMKHKKAAAGAPSPHDFGSAFRPICNHAKRLVRDSASRSHRLSSPESLACSRMNNKVSRLRFTHPAFACLPVDHPPLCFCLPIAQNNGVVFHDFGSGFLKSTISNPKHIGRSPHASAVARSLHPWCWP